jgi:hypothetical protein
MISFSLPTNYIQMSLRAASAQTNLPGQHHLKIRDIVELNFGGESKWRSRKKKECLSGMSLRRASVQNLRCGI